MLAADRLVLIRYMEQCMREEDWHGTADHMRADWLCQRCHVPEHHPKSGPPTSTA